MLKVAVDVGGTFTDLVAVDTAKGELFVIKDRSTPQAPEVGFLSIMKRLFDEKSADPTEVEQVIHVGTIGSNLFRGQLGLKPPRVALITTRGFRDILEIGRQNRPELYNIFYQRPRPLVPRRLRFEARERVSAEGEVVEPVSEEELRAIADRLGQEGVESLAVCFLNSYLNPKNERRAREVVGQHLSVPVFISSEVDREHREYERTSTTVVCAALAPVLARYLERAGQGLDELGVKGPIHVFSSAGGLVDVEEVRRRPIVAVESGPAAGVVGAAELARQLGLARVISLDMGGTTAKAGSVVDYQPSLVPEFEVGGRAHMGRLVKGSGYPVRFPSVDLAEVSAGGGTIIWVDEAGGLRVGPMSAGADPGPACYGRGGEMPTITDANLVLGRLPDALLGGEMKLERGLAEKALYRVAEAVGMDVYGLAEAAVRLVNHEMARAVRLVTLERGLDPTGFTLMAFGGAGPMHAAELAQELGVRSVVVPPLPGLFSALGLLMTDMRFTYVRGLIRPLDELDPATLSGAFEEMRAHALSSLSKRGLELRGCRLHTSLDLRYYGQGWEIEVPVAPPYEPSIIQREFEAKHEASYGFGHPGERVELVALRLAITIPVMKPDLRSLTPPGRSWGEARLGIRNVFFGGAWHRATVYSRDLLPLGEEAEGPAVVEEYSSTTVVPPGWSFHRDELGCLVMRWRRP
jgi:N-methylhydantoinase A